jgi:hypothetical protein
MMTGCNCKKKKKGENLSDVSFCEDEDNDEM